MGDDRRPEPGLDRVSVRDGDGHFRGADREHGPLAGARLLAPPDGGRAAGLAFLRLETNVAAFDFLVLAHYRYYKFYANMVVALVWAYATRGYALGLRGFLYWPLAWLFFFASRDALRKYYERTGSLLGPGDVEPPL